MKGHYYKEMFGCSKKDLAKQLYIELYGTVEELTREARATCEEARIYRERTGETATLQIPDGNLESPRFCR